MTMPRCSRSSTPSVEPLLDATVAEVFALTALVPRPLRSAVLAREELVRRWPWSRHRHPAARVLDVLLSTRACPAT
jgi:hypothetical protein